VSNLTHEKRIVFLFPSLHFSVFSALLSKMVSASVARNIIGIIGSSLFQAATPNFEQASAS